MNQEINKKFNRPDWWRWIYVVLYLCLCGHAVASAEKLSLGVAERHYGQWRELSFEIAIIEARGLERNERGITLADLRKRYQKKRLKVKAELSSLAHAKLSVDDRKAMAYMQTQLDLAEAETVASARAPACAIELLDRANVGNSYEQLSANLYACYGAAAGSIATPDGTMDRLSVLSRLASEPDSEVRRAFWLSLQPVWKSVNGNNGETSPYRHLIGLSAARWRVTGSPIALAAQSLGLDPAQTESTLEAILATWRDRSPKELVEPWDWYYQNYAVNRFLAKYVPKDRLRELNTRYYRSMGADPDQLGIHFDLEPRVGKTPVAFAQFAIPARLRQGVYGGSQSWIFANYREGGFDNLVELLHETGHAVHISAIATRPAYADWPDSDPFTEAIADVTALEAYDGGWQQKFLGIAADADVSLRGKHAGTVMDIAWALFELRMHRDPSADPNLIWSTITQEYLRIAPHSEYAWWAMRGQLVEVPGYMMNYALGAILSAALRERVRELHGPFRTTNADMYSCLRQGLYRFGLERPARQVVEDFLGKSLNARALIAEIEQLSRPAAQ